jgi:hypothetical protein
MYRLKIQTKHINQQTFISMKKLILVFVIFSLFSCKKKTTTTATTPTTAPICANCFNHYIGEIYGGGIIVSVWKIDGVEHGLIASLKDVSTSSVWSNVSTTLIGATAQNPRDGQANTNSIISQIGHTTSAAKLCDEYTSGGYSDWYLPAGWELNLCYYATTIVNEVLGDTNGFQSSFYWASSEYSANDGWIQTFPYGGTGATSKASNRFVRAVRRF